MMKQRQRKTVEELYGSKLDAPKSQVTANQQNGGQKTGRISERDNSFIISSSMPINGAAVQKSLTSGRETERRKSARASNKINNEKQSAKETFVMDNDKKPSTHLKNKKKFDNKTGGNFEETPYDVALQRQHQQKQHHHQHHHQNQNHRSNVHDEDKDDDTDEFFELIRRTVESAIGKSISELLNRNFRELSSKVDRFSGELKSTNALLNQLQNEMSNKIGHYGEENSRHFRYLCMKSEYDKMFYQHQTLIATTKPPNEDTLAKTKSPETRKRSVKPNKSATNLQRRENATTHKKDSCPCLNKNCKSATPGSELKQTHTNSSENVSQKSSEIGMRNVLEQIQKFCTQMQFNDLKCVPSGEGLAMSQQRNVIRSENFIEVNEEAFADEDETEDDDEWEVSSDGMTPRNALNDSHNNYGGVTSRGSITSRGNTTQRRNNGAGDG